MQATRICEYLLSFLSFLTYSYVPSFFYPFIFHPPFLTIGLLETVAPLVIRKLAILERVTGVEERLHAQFILVKVDGTQLRLVQE